MKVRVGMQEGWVSSAYIKVINTTPSTSKPNPPASGKTVYLTFDDGPSKNTNKILDILKQNNIQGTFFVLGTSIKNNKNSNALLNRMVKEGHYIGLHSVSHDKSNLYQGSSASRNFLNEMLELQREVKYRTGFESKLYRPPYGTISNFTQSHITTMKNSNLRGWDWNVDSNDWNSKTTKQVMDNVKSGLHLRRDSDFFVVLFHEHDITIEALPKVIEHFKSLGYEFKVYDPSNHFQMNLIKEPNL